MASSSVSSQPAPNDAGSDPLAGGDPPLPNLPACSYNDDPASHIAHTGGVAYAVDDLYQQGASISSGTFRGTVINAVTGNDVVIQDAERAYDVRERPNTYLGLSRFTYANRASYAGLQRIIEVSRPETHNIRRARRTSAHHRREIVLGLGVLAGMY